jgi:anaerobic selenocysteine-containing dehydrogenase
VVENGRFVALEPDPSHPTGKALCAKGRAAPELVYHSDRLLYPLKRTRPKGDPDPGWQRISWDEALDLTAARLGAIREENGPESVVFSVVSPSTSASDDSVIWIQRLMNAFGSPNLCVAMELCGWGRHLATQYTFGAAVPGAYMPDLEHAGCILFWGYNPNLARLAHATATVDALKRGARLIVVDPRGWYDRDFVRDWTNGPLLVRADNGRLLTQSDLSAEGSAEQYVAWSEAMGRPINYDPATGGYEGDTPELALLGTYTIETLQGNVVCRPAFDLMAELCRHYTPDRVEAICGVEGEQVEAAARMLWEARPVAYYAWSGVKQHTNTTQMARAIAQICVLTGSLDGPGGNVLFAAASQERGLLSVVSVLASLYPLVTVLLARIALGERVQRTQEAGVVVTLTGVALISAG